MNVDEIKNKSNCIFFNDINQERVNKIFSLFEKERSKVNVSITPDGNEIYLGLKNELNDCNGFIKLGIVSYNEETNEVSLVFITKEYNDAYENNLSVGLAVLTSAKSEIYDEFGVKIYESTYSDEVILIDDNIDEMVTVTTPIYSQGRMVEEPLLVYKPFINVWERYKNTHVYHEHGKSPIKGDFSDIGIQYDINEDKIKLISDIRGSFIYSNEFLPGSEDDIVIMLEDAYKKTYDMESDDFFDYERREIIDDIISNYIDKY